MTATSKPRCARVIRAVVGEVFAKRRCRAGPPVGSLSWPLGRYRVHGIERNAAVDESDPGSNERYGVDSTRAIAMVTRLSQDSNVKLLDVAGEVVTTTDTSSHHDPLDETR